MKKWRMLQAFFINTFPNFYKHFFHALNIYCVPFTIGMYDEERKERSNFSHYPIRSEGERDK